jgi:hypothetical protein
VIFFFFFFEIGSHELFPWAGFELGSPDLCLLSNWDYRHESQALGRISSFDFCAFLSTS